MTSLTTHPACGKRAEVLFDHLAVPVHANSGGLGYALINTEEVSIFIQTS